MTERAGNTIAGGPDRVLAQDLGVQRRQLAVLSSVWYWVVTMIMLPVGVVVGLAGLLMVVGGLFSRIDSRQ